MKLTLKHQKAIKALLPKEEWQAFVDDAIASALKKHPKKKAGAGALGSIEIYADGGSRGNPGIAGGGFVVFKNGELVSKGSEFYGQKTNNQAEYLALRDALREAYRLFKNCRIKCFLDSKLIVEQMKGNYKVKSENMKPLFEEVRRIADQFEHFEIEHVPRAQNKLADQLANEAMDRKR